MTTNFPIEYFHEVIHQHRLIEVKSDFEAGWKACAESILRKLKEIPVMEIQDVVKEERITNG